MARFAVLLGVAAAAQPREWSVILDAPSRWAKPLSQASVSRELEPVFVTERPWRLRLRVRDLVERYRGRGAAEILERSGVTRLVVIAAGLGDDVATALWKTARTPAGRSSTADDAPAFRESAT
ncbi:hypothetical protein JL720_9358 [Aureococcus anophagefferens]|nr:hypothetical protein JL720_9358 [Aureococcus anophagefferens]